MDNVQKGLMTVVLGLVILMIVWFFQTRSKNPSSAKPTWLILGINGAGKTSIFYKWNEDEKDEVAEGEKVSTVSSIEANYGTISLPFANPSIAKPFQLIDYPGHLKYFNLLQKLIIDEVTLHKVKGIVFVIDSSQFKQSAHTVCKYLFNLLSITERLHNGVDFLFAVNKNDLFDSTPASRVKQMMEEEINKLIQNELSAIDKNDDMEDNSSPVDSETLREFWLGVVGSKSGKFSFEQLEGNMDFAAGSVLKNKIEVWENWLDERVVNRS
ncbi:signal recognition particle receptor subunit beta [Diutina catenulata]